MENRHDEALAHAQKLREIILEPMKKLFVSKDEIIEALGICLVAGENLFILGPPGTAKSAIVMELARRMQGKVFDYLLTRFTEPNEIFGPFDIRKLREGELKTNTEGMLPEAELVFLDELLNANSAILNSLLTVLNERIFRRGRENWSLPTLLIIGASNRLPEDETLGALFDRFLMRVGCENVPSEDLSQVLHAGWLLEQGLRTPEVTMSTAEIRLIQSIITDVDLAPVRIAYEDVIHRLRHAGIALSDRRAVKIQRLIAASSLLCGRLTARHSDFWVIRNIWDREEQQEVIASLIQDYVDKDRDKQELHHPQSIQSTVPDPHILAREIDTMSTRLEEGIETKSERNVFKDRLSLLAARCQWIENDNYRVQLDEQIQSLWQKIHTLTT